MDHDDVPPPPPRFDDAFRLQLENLYRWRRDVRRFRNEPLNEDLLAHLLALACLAPSVGLSQPWRFVRVQDAARRGAVRDNFLVSNQSALANYEGERAKLYASLKLAGLDEAPVQLAVFCDEATEVGHGLGRATMPEMSRYSVVAAVQGLWLAARAWGVGLGWVSILQPDKVAEILEVPSSWVLVAYLCLGYPQEEQEAPELERQRWEHRRPETAEVLIR